MNKVNIALTALILPFLTANFMAMGMKKEQSKDNRPLIKAIVYFNPEKPAFYATKKQLKHLNEKGIATPTLPVVREVAEVKVLEANGSVTDWLKQPTMSIKSYEKKQSAGQTLSFAQNLQRNLALQNKTFPKILPVELGFNCSNFSKIGLTIDQFPVQATFASNANFETEQSNCMTKFYDNPIAGLSMPEIKELIADDRINSAIINIRLTLNPGEEPTFTMIDNTATHKDNSYSSEQGCYKKIIDSKMQPHTNALQYLRHREAGMRPQRRLGSEQDLDAILNDCLREMESNSSQ